MFFRTFLVATISFFSAFSALNQWSTDYTIASVAIGSVSSFCISEDGQKAICLFWESTPNTLNTSYTTDHGQNWHTSTPFSGNASGSVSMDSDGLNALCAYRTTTSRLYAKWSNDFGVNWINSQQVGASTTVFYVVTAISSDGSKAYIVYSDSSDNLYFTSSTNYGVSWSVPSFVVAGSNPSMTVSSDGQKIYLAYCASGQVRLAYSVNSGAAWNFSTIPFTFPTPPPASTSISASSDGNKICIAVSDFSYSPFVAYSNNGGVNWTVSTQSLSGASPSIATDGNGVTTVFITRDAVSPCPLYSYYNFYQQPFSSIGEILPNMVSSPRLLSIKQELSLSGCGLILIKIPFLQDLLIFLHRLLLLHTPL